MNADKPEYQMNQATVELLRGLARVEQQMLAALKAVEAWDVNAYESALPTELREQVTAAIKLGEECKR